MFDARLRNLRLCGTAAFCAIVLGFGAAGARAADGGFEASFAVNRQKVTIGDEIVISADIAHDDAFKVEELTRDLQLPPFIVKRIERVPPKKAKGVTAEGFRITLTIFETGRFVVPAIPIRFKDPSGKPGVVHTEKWPIEVFSVLGAQAEAKDIRPLKDPLSLETEAQRRRRWILIGAGLLAALFMAGLGWLGWKRYQAWLEARKPAHRKALEALDRLDKKQLIVSGQPKLYYAELVEILKLYLIRRFGAGSLDETTREFLDALEAVPPAAAESGAVRSILNAADLVKFARALPEAGEAKTALEEVRQIVLRTAPVEPVKSGRAGKRQEPAGAPAQGQGASR